MLDFSSIKKQGGYIVKALVCEMCGSGDLIKQDGNFVCQHCGMKYSLEEAKKMMVEGTVKVDNSDFVEKYLQNARRAKQKEDWEETEKYYNMVEQNDPSNIEAIFYSAYGKAKASLCVNEIYKREAIFKALTKSISILDDNYDPNNSKAIAPILEQIVMDTINLFGSEFVYTKTTNGNGQVSDDRNKTYQLFINVGVEMYNTLQEILKKLTNKEDKIFICKLELKLIDFFIFGNSNLSDQSKLHWYDQAAIKSDDLKKMDATFSCKDYRAEKAAYEKRLADAQKAANGCLIAFGIVALIGIVAFFAWLMS